MIRRGAAAGISTVLGVLVAILTNVYTDGWWWPAGLGLGGVAVTWIGWEAWRASGSGESGVVIVKRTGPAVADGPGSIANTGAIGRAGSVEVRHSEAARAVRGGVANSGAMESGRDRRSDD